MNDSNRQLHVVFGVGQIGTPLAQRLVAAGHAVRTVRRSGRTIEGADLRLGDAGDAAFATAACEGASVVYHCVNPAYDATVWARELPRLASSLVAAAGRAKARLVVLDNVYMLGKPAGRPLSEASPIAPVSRKGEIRARVHEQLMAAHQRGDVRLVMGRASDFYGPGGTLTYFGDPFWPNVLKSGAARVLANPDTPHTYHYTLDVAAGLATLGTAPDDATGRWWMLPCAPAETTRQMIARLGTALGRELSVQRMPAWLLRLLALGVPILRELVEMSYQWDEAFVIDDRKFRERFGATPTSLDEGARGTVHWAKEHYGGASR